MVNFRFVDFLELVFFAGFALGAAFLAAVFFFAGEAFLAAATFFEVFLVAFLATFFEVFLAGVAFLLTFFAGVTFLDASTTLFAVGLLSGFSVNSSDIFQSFHVFVI